MFVTQTQYILDGETKKAIRKTGSTVEENTQRMEQMERRLDELQRQSQALWKLVQSHLNLDITLLEQTVDELERELQEQNQIKVQCTNCRLDVHKHKEKCIYCGTPLVAK